MAGVFEIIGPIMVGPSSSHTAGAVNIGRAVRQLLGFKPVRADISLYGSFAFTHEGHGTDRAVVAGILGMTAADSRIKKSLEIAEQKGIKVNFDLQYNEHPYHPNLAEITLYGNLEQVQLVGASIGGGRILIKEVNNFNVNISGEYNTLFCSYYEKLGMIARVSSLLAEEGINIAFMKVSRDKSREKALMVVECDQRLTDSIIAKITKVPSVYRVQYLEKPSL